MTAPTVSVVIPTYQEADHIEACLAAVAAQTYPHLVEVLVVDGLSNDGTPAIAAAAGATVIENPRRVQSVALNIGIARAAGDVVVRVDGHCLIAPDYVERCVEVLYETGAAMVGGAMTPVATGVVQTGIAAAMASPLGAGPARFHTGGDAAWVDTVYLGAYRTDLVRRVGAYAEDVGVNEDAELAHRMGEHGGIRFDPSIRSTYTPRSTMRAVIRQFYRYGRGRAQTVTLHPRSLRPRQLVAPALVIGLSVPRVRRPVAAAYLGVIGLVAARQVRHDGRAAAVTAAVLPCMHLPWGVGFITGLTRVTPPPRPPDGAR